MVMGALLRRKKRLCGREAHEFHEANLRVLKTDVESKYRAINKWLVAANGRSREIEVENITKDSSSKCSCGRVNTNVR